MRVLVLALVGVVLLAGAAASAWGHGDQFRDPVPGNPPPGYPSPPWLRDLPDPTPPPPPPESSSVRTPPPLAVPKRVRLPAEDWFFWWQVNATRFERLTRTTDPTKDVRGVLASVLDGAIPADAHLEAAAHLAYGKVAREETDVRRMLAALEGLAARPAKVQEAATLALGLLRRRAPRDPFPAPLLETVRAALLGLLEDGARPPRLRGFAALSLGLLAGQPTDGDARARARELTRRLFARVAAHGDNEEPGTSALVAIGLFGPDGVDAETLAKLRRLARTDRREGGHAHTWVSAQAVRALGCVGTAADVDRLREILRNEERLPYRHVCAVRALDLLGRRSDRETRTRIVTLLQTEALRSKVAEVRGQALLALATLVVRDLPREGRLSDADVLSTVLLLERARRPLPTEGGYAALALGVLGRAEGMGSGAGAVRHKAREALERLCDHPDATDRTRVAAHLALGLARAEGLRLTNVLDDHGQPAELRAMSAWGLGLRGASTTGVAASLRRGMRGSDPEIRRRSVRALALLGHPPLPRIGMDAVAVLLERLARRQTEVERVDTVIQLARFGDHRAVGPLGRIVESPREPSLVRALAASALGALSDPESPSAFDLLREDSNYRARSTVLRDVYRYL